MQSAAMPPRARGAVSISAKPGPRGSALDRMRQAGSLKVLFPRRQSEALDAVLVNTAGGVTGGDRFKTEATAATGTKLTITTQAAERAYRAMPGQTGTIDNVLTVETGAQINWLPQETILFQGSALKRRLCVDLQCEAKLLICEPLVFGRTAMNETLTDAALADEIRVTRNGSPLYIDRLVMNGDLQAKLARAGVAAGAGALATVLFIAPNAEAHIKALRKLCPDSGGVSLLGPDTLTIRLLALDSHILRQSLVPILNRLSGTTLPRPWML